MASLLKSGCIPLVVNRGSQCLLTAIANVTQTQRLISSKTMRGGPRAIPHPPYPYEEKPYGIWQSIFDKTTKRINENSKMICVEGPIAAGKTKLAQQLADEFEMLYVPAADMDMYYINPYGYDMRQLDDQLPDDSKSFDVKDFCRNPKHKLSARLQIQMYYLRFEQYVDGLAHILNTGQGVVLDRSPHSDFVFMEAMHKLGYVSNGAKSVYNEIRENTITELLRPHLVIYLDVPVKAVKERIKARAIDYEVNSEVFNDQYLQTMENVYKQKFLKRISKHAELLIYDWTEDAEAEVVVEDIERINFEQYERNLQSIKMGDWNFKTEELWSEQRIKYGTGKSDLMSYFNVPRFDVPELLRSGEHSKVYCEVWMNAPGMKYHLDYNADMGDTGILTKTKMRPKGNKIF